MNSPQPSTGPRVRYEQATAMHASQVIVNSVEETMFLDCSSGFVLDEDSGTPILPIHTRLAITTATARDLGELLISVADEMDAETEEEAGSNDGKEPVEYGPTPNVTVGTQEESTETLLEAVHMHRKVARATNALPQAD